MAKKDDLDDEAGLGIDPEGAIKETLDDEKSARQDADEDDSPTSTS
jgi:hypothetical protein